MGAIKDLVDLVGKLINSVQDRKFAAELREIQSMISGILSEHAELHESRIALMTENDKLKKQIPALETRIAKLEQENLKLLDPPHTEPPADDDVKILCELKHPHAKGYDNVIAKKLGISLSILNYRADLLRRSGYIFIQDEHDQGASKYWLTPKGRKFLFDKNLLD